MSWACYIERFLTDDSDIQREICNTFVIPLVLLCRQIRLPICFMSRLSALHLAPTVSVSLLVYILELSLSSSANVHQPWHLSPSPQDPLFPAGLPPHLAPLLLHFRFGFGYLLTYCRQQTSPRCATDDV